MATNVRGCRRAAVAGLLLAICSPHAGQPGFEGKPVAAEDATGREPVAQPDPGRAGSGSIQHDGPEPDVTGRSELAPSRRLPSPFSWLAPIDTSVDATFRADEFATAENRANSRQREAGRRAVPMDTGDPDPATHPYDRLRQGHAARRPARPCGRRRCPVVLPTPAQLLIDVPTGWAPAVDAGRRRDACSAAYSRPPSPMTVDQPEPTQLVDGLAACYGSAEITIAGDLARTAEPVSWVTGAFRLAGGSGCSIWRALPSLWSRPGSRNAAVRGHRPLRDPAARSAARPRTWDASLCPRSSLSESLNRVIHRSNR